MAGVTTTGFVPKTLGDLKTEIGTGLRAVFGASINLDARARFGQLRDLIASPLSALWDLGEAITGAFDPAAANGVLLDNLCALTGTFRRQPFPSTVDLYCTGVDGTVLLVGRRARVNGTSVIFETLTEITLATATPWAAGAIAAGQVRSSAGGIWLCTVGGTAAAAPTGAGPTFADGVLRWRRLGDGLAYAVTDAQAIANGPLQGYAYTITVIDTAVVGWNGVTNPLDAVPGALREEDPALRVRRNNEIAAIGSSPLPAIFAELLKVAGVSTVTVFENTTDTTVDSITPHAIEALIEGGVDADIREAIFAAKAAGIATCGNVSGSVNDVGGNPHTIKFSRPADVDIYVRLEVIINAGEYPTDGDNQLKAAIVARGDLELLGRNAVSSRIGAWAFGVPGVLEVIAKVNTSYPATATTTIPISIRERAAYDTSRIEVATTPGIP